MKKLPEAFSRCIGDKDIVFLDNNYSDKIISAVEINNKASDPFCTYDYNKNGNFKNNTDELLFVLFQTFVGCSEYNYTLGCSSYLHYVRDEYYYLYTSSAVLSSILTKIVCLDEARFTIPKELEINTEKVIGNNKLFFEIQMHLYAIIETGMFFNECIKLIDKVNLEDYRRVVNLEGYDLDNFMHLDGIFRKIKINFLTTSEILINLRRNLEFLKKFMESKKKINFILRNLKKLQNLPCYFKGFMASYLDSDMRFLVLDVGAFINNLDKIFVVSNFYIKYSCIKFYYRLLLYRKLIEINELFYGYKFLLDFLSICPDEDFLHKEQERIGDLMKKIDEKKTEDINSGVFLCYNLLKKHF